MSAPVIRRTQLTVGDKLRQASGTLQCFIDSNGETPDGLLDCRDNDGSPFQSEYMAGLIDHARLGVAFIDEAIAATDATANPVDGPLTRRDLSEAFHRLNSEDKAVDVPSEMADFLNARIASLTPVAVVDKRDAEIERLTAVLAHIAGTSDDDCSRDAARAALKGASK